MGQRFSTAGWLEARDRLDRRSPSLIARELRGDPVQALARDLQTSIVNLGADAEPIPE